VTPRSQEELEELEELEKEEREAEMMETLEDEYQRSQKVEFGGTTRIIKNLQKIPDFKYRLTSQQRDVLSKAGN
jgi:hypothetical protein